MQGGDAVTRRRNHRAVALLVGGACASDPVLVPGGSPPGGPSTGDTPTEDTPAEDTPSDSMTCSDPMPVPVCPEAHAAPPPPAVGTPCATSADCASTEFCGAGHCRDLATAVVTLCLNQGWMQGPKYFADPNPPNLYAVAYQTNVWQGYTPTFDTAEPDEFDEVWSDTIADSCSPTWNDCGLFALEYAPELRFRLRELNDDSTGVYPQLDLWEGISSLTLASQIGQGCIEVDEQDQAGTATDARIWYSVWYP